MALSDAFKWIDEALHHSVNEQVREHLRLQGVENERCLQRIEERVFTTFRQELRQELRDHVDEQLRSAQREAVRRQEEFEEGIIKNFQDRACQLHRAWTQEQDGVFARYRRQGEELCQSLVQQMDQRLQSMVLQHEELKAKLLAESRHQEEKFREKISHEVSQLRTIRELLHEPVSPRTRSRTVSEPAVLNVVTSDAAAPFAVFGNAGAQPPTDIDGQAPPKVLPVKPQGAVHEDKAAGMEIVCAKAEDNAAGQTPPTEATPMAPSPPLATAAAPQSDMAAGAEACSAHTGAAEADLQPPDLLVASEHLPSRENSVAASDDFDAAVIRSWVTPAEAVEALDPGEAESQAARARLKPSLWFSRRVVAFLGSLLVAAIGAFCVKPYLTVAFILIVFVWVVFLCGEEPTIRLISGKAHSAESDFCRRRILTLVACLRKVQGWRSSHEKEMQSMALLYSFCILLCLLNPDATNISRLLIETFDGTVTVLILVLAAFATTYFARCLVNYLHQPTLRRPLHGAAEYPVGSAAAKARLQDIKEHLKSTTGHRRRKSERAIKAIFAESDDGMLNDLLAEMSHSNACSLANVVLFFQDEPFLEARSDFLKLLCRERCGELFVRSKSVVLDALMLMKLSSCEYAEEAVADLLTSCFGDELSELKSLQDAGNVQSMHKLIYENLTSEVLRRRILDHFLCESIGQVAHRTLMANSHFARLLEKGLKRACVPDAMNFVQAGDTPGEPEYHGRCGHSWLKIFTDIDDTLECSGGRWPAGIDARYPRHTPYPGVTAFYRELQGGGTVGQLVALSARPHVVGTVVEESVMKKFANLRSQHGLHCMPALLTGAVDTGAKFFFSGGNEDGMIALGMKKFENIVDFIRLYPEFRLVFVGDNGQADFAVGQMICKRFPQHVEQVWIHEVQPREKTFHYDVHSTEKHPVDFFDDYVDAAVQAATRRQPLITPDGLHRVVTAAVSDFRGIQNWASEENRVRELERLSKSVEVARAVLLDLGVSAEVEPLQDPQPAPDIPLELAPALRRDEQPEAPRYWWRGKRERTKQVAVADAKAVPVCSGAASGNTSVANPGTEPNSPERSPAAEDPSVAPALQPLDLSSPRIADSSVEQQSTTQMFLQWVRRPQPNDTNVVDNPPALVPTPIVRSLARDAAEAPVADEPDAELMPGGTEVLVQVGGATLASDPGASSTGSIISRALDLARSATVSKRALPTATAPTTAVDQAEVPPAATPDGAAPAGTLEAPDGRGGSADATSVVAATGPQISGDEAELEPLSPIRECNSEGLDAEDVGAAGGDVSGTVGGTSTSVGATNGNPTKRTFFALARGALRSSAPSPQTGDAAQRHAGPEDGNGNFEENLLVPATSTETSLSLLPSKIEGVPADASCEEALLADHARPADVSPSSPNTTAAADSDALEAADASATMASDTTLPNEGSSASGSIISRALDLARGAIPIGCPPNKGDKSRSSSENSSETPSSKVPMDLPVDDQMPAETAGPADGSPGAAPLSEMPEGEGSEAAEFSATLSTDNTGAFPATEAPSAPGSIISRAFDLARGATISKKLSPVPSGESLPAIPLMDAPQIPFVPQSSEGFVSVIQSEPPTALCSARTVDKTNDPPCAVATPGAPDWALDDCGSLPAPPEKHSAATPAESTPLASEQQPSHLQKRSLLALARGAFMSNAVHPGAARGPMSTIRSMDSMYTCSSADEISGEERDIRFSSHDDSLGEFPAGAPGVDVEGPALDGPGGQTAEDSSAGAPAGAATANAGRSTSKPSAHSPRSQQDADGDTDMADVSAAGTWAASDADTPFASAVAAGGVCSGGQGQAFFCEPPDGTREMHLEAEPAGATPSAEGFSEGK